MNLKQLLPQFKEELAGLYDDQEVVSIYHMLVHHLSGFNKMQLILKGAEFLEQHLESRYRQVLQELKHGKPVQYILGETLFYGLPFKVNPAVLIPRPETEELVDWIIADASGRLHKILDIGTGSGCIAISLKKNLIDSAVSALDVSEDALNTAKENALLNGLDISFIHADIITYHSDEKFDVIVSNPPYIKADEMGEMHQNVLSNEPHLALFVSNERPLIFYEAIADFAKLNLQNGGLLYFEINEYLGKETINMLEDKGFIGIELRKDMQGKDRMVRCALPKS
ncbi:peptide chain release factor N(5)-glutamine methyltransferase [Pedobacter metabolipauper]|uniref:peptide chain release factor N(5)-glutamine methyltransferase n=1 Tax=Pedobacter metabolipauper TaxID=425513 RepID=A0A4R6SZX1_9SPHI|nr:peptide chain release factor N(5)-glutamine methyltransferase [Pedobacter metabolipauper]TDQ11672.1 release factor glutamine methyltransferase [Pedobacter metabolipauper]